MSVSGHQSALRVGTTIANAEGSGADEPAITGTSFSLGNSAEALYKYGQRNPSEVKEGNIDVSFDITADYQGDTTWMARAGVGSTGELTEYYVALYPKGAVAARPEVRLLGKFNNYKLDAPQAGVHVESMTFIGKLVATGNAFIG